MKKQLLTFALLLLAFVSTAQEAKQTFTRKVLIEQFTTGQCQYCPAGNDRLASAVSGLNNIIWIKHHAGFGTDALTNDAAQAYTVFFGGSTYAPALMIDRTRFDTSNPGPVGNVGLSSDIRALLSKARAVETYCKVYPVEVTYNADTRHLSGAVRGRFGDEVYDENTRLSLYVVEDSFYMYQSDAYNGSGNIYHMSAVRTAITDIWGDPITVEGSSREFAYTIDYTLPEEYVYKNCRLVALVSNYDANDINNCAVFNASESEYLNKTLAIGEVESGSSLRLYPNPAETRVYVQADEAISHVWVVNALGQMVMHQEGGSATLSLDLDGLAAGLYMVRIQTPAGLAVRQLVVR